MDTDEIGDNMKGEFASSVQIPDDWQFMDNDELEDQFEMAFDAYGFIHDDGQRLIFVNLGGLPETFDIMALKTTAADADVTVSKQETHISTAAAEIVTELMQDDSLWNH